MRKGNNNTRADSILPQKTYYSLCTKIIIHILRSSYVQLYIKRLITNLHQDPCTTLLLHCSLYRNMGLIFRYGIQYQDHMDQMLNLMFFLAANK